MMGSRNGHEQGQRPALHACGPRMRFTMTRVALLVVLLVLGHDIFMAARSAVALEHHAAAAHYVSAGPQLSPRAMAAADDSPRDHPVDCSVSQVAAPRASQQPEAQTEAVAAHAVAMAPPSTHAPISGAWQEPLWPPGVRRALVQVYRI